MSTLFYPILIRQFIKEFFDWSIIAALKTPTANIGKPKSPSPGKNFNNKKLYFVVASFMIPKKVINLFQFEKNDIISNIEGNKRKNS